MIKKLMITKLTEGRTSDWGGRSASNWDRILRVSRRTWERNKWLRIKMHIRVRILCVTYFRDVGGQVSIQDLVEVQQGVVGQVLWNTTEGQACVVKVSEEQGRQVCGKPPVSRINTSVTFAVRQQDSSLHSVMYRRTEFIWSTVIRERGSAELSRVRRQLKVCLATYRPAVEGRHFGEIKTEIKFNE